MTSDERQPVASEPPAPPVLARAVATAVSRASAAMVGGVEIVELRLIDGAILVDGPGASPPKAIPLADVVRIRFGWMKDRRRGFEAGDLPMMPAIKLTRSGQMDEIVFRSDFERSRSLTRSTGNHGQEAAVAMAVLSREIARQIDSHHPRTVVEIGWGSFSESIGALFSGFFGLCLVLGGIAYLAQLDLVGLALLLVGAGMMWNARPRKPVRGRPALTAVERLYSDPLSAAPST